MPLVIYLRPWFSRPTKNLFMLFYFYWYSNDVYLSVLFISNSWLLFGSYRLLPFNISSRTVSRREMQFFFYFLKNGLNQKN